MKFLSSTLISQLSPHIVCWCSTIAIMRTSPLSIGEYINEARLAQSVEHGTLNPRVVGSSPTSGYFIACSFINPRRHLYKTICNLFIIIIIIRISDD
ncbi:hypothetical protein T08_13459 [Trichinella sp. T8]|nr:hypothetical protein T08_13459 [Trichinella sp. T8]